MALMESNRTTLLLGDVVDRAAIQSLLQDFYDLTGIPVSVIDLEGRELVGVGWQKVCTDFHRVNPDSCRNCIESDTELSAGVAPGQFRLYKCKNNMWDVATPLVIAGEHVGNVFSGQFFFDDEPLDRETFRAQAARYGFPAADYLGALDEVPRLSREHVRKGMAFLTKLAHMLSVLGLKNVSLARALAERESLACSLRESAEGLSRAQEIAHLGSWDLDLPTGRLLWSDEVYRIFGLRPQEFGATYEAFLEAVHPEDRAAVDAAYSGSLAAGQDNYEITHRVVRRATGEVRWVHEKCRHARDASGTIVRSIGMVQDITERRLAENGLRDSEERFRRLTQTIPQLVFTLSAEGECDYVSRQWAEYTGSAVEEHLGRGWVAHVLPEDRDKVERAWNAAQLTKEPLAVELRIRSSSGQYRWFAARAVPFRGKDGAGKWFGTCTDIERQKRTEQALRRFTDDLRQFTFVASHDLQEPLRTVACYSQMLQREIGDQLSANGREWLGFIVGGAKRISGLISDLRSYYEATMPSGRVATAIDCGALIDGVVRDLGPLIAEKRAVVEHDRLPVVQGDEIAIRQVLQNLVANAIKYSRPDEPPRVLVTANPEGTDWVFSVSDNGIGFDPGHRERIFGIFKRLHGQDVPGTGVGLAICRTIIERHGGRIWAESEPGRGSTFRFSLPLTPSVS